MSNHDLHHDWLALIEISGPFLAVPVLKEAFPQGLEELDGTKRKRLRQAYEEWREALETDDPQFAELHAAWIDEVLARGLELDEDGKGDVLKRTDWCAAELNVSLPEHGVTLSPDLAVIDEQRADKPQMLIHTYGQDVDLDATLKLDGWAATPADRMVQLCRATGCRLGLVTNGERWMLVDAPVGAITTFASWYARIWSQEPITLQAFVHLLGIRRFFVGQAEQLPALFDRSLKYQDEVTDALGEQVRRAVEVLIQALDKADQDRDRELLRDVKEPVLYEAALTVMMRLVFLLSAEERGLLLLGDERYETNYALSTLRMQLRKESEEILERRWDAWSRLLAIFRAVFGGIEHENLRLPALGGSLFDPDRFPFLEGRAKGSDWRTDTAKPLPIDNRTVLLLLEAIQQFQGRTLSYRALDVEQIGYVYEGLLERTVKRTAEVTLELDGTKNAKAPWVRLAELESARMDGAVRLAELLQERSGSSASRVRNDLAKPIDDMLADRLLAACHGDTSLRNRIKPFAHLVRTDPWGYPLVYPAGAFIVTTGSDRRETGTHYTPKSLTEAIVTETLTPIVYVGPAEGTPPEQWVLKSPAELLDLKICDPAMGSGAFLVQACRWLADRLVEAWSQAQGSGKTVSVDGEVLDAPDTKEPLPRDTEARTVIARRLIAERCLYGVDLNPLAVELAKLSIWLVTLAKGRPFGFLDHNLRCGDSLLGIHRLDQLTQLSMKPTGQGQLRLFGQNVEQAVREAIELRSRLREMPIRDIRDVEAMAHLDADARRRLEVPECIADAFIGEVFVSGGNGAALESTLASLTIQAGQAIDGDRDVLASMRRRLVAALSTDLPVDKPARRPFHWPLEFPEVFAREAHGFDVIVGNPPFSGGRWIGRRLGLTYQEYLKLVRNGVVGSPDLCVYFYLRAFSLLGSKGCFGLLATKSITETGSRVVCLDQIIGMGGTVYRGCSRMAWPGNAAVVVSIAWVARDVWQGQRVLDDRTVSAINGALEEDFQIKRPMKLKALKGKFSQGQDIMGRGFELTAEERAEILAADPSCAEVVFPLFNGQDLNTMPRLEPYRWVIYFRDWPEEKARRYGAAFRRAKELVKPYRDSLTGQIHQDCYWKFWDLRPQLISELDARMTVLASAINSKYVSFRRVPTGNVYNKKTKLYFIDAWWEFAVLQSSFHQEWAFWTCGTLGASTINYSTSVAFETWPMPTVDKGIQAGLEKLGEEYHALREQVLLQNEFGLTKLYNRFHDPSDDDSRIELIRSLHREIDIAVARAYGWDDFELEHGFHEVPYLPESDRVRFTISDRVRLAVLHRLSELNHQRYEEEVAEGLHGSGTTRMSSRAPRAGRAARAAPAQPSLDFDAGAAATINGATPATAILGFLSASDGWHAKADVLAATRITDGQWSAAIADLIAGGRVERQGERRGARYRATTGVEGSP
ncbi:ATP phosphoribosyltransferase regulatory subunit [Xanthomonas campestris pv. campestris]|uniref:Eco57I restriction-modification methylase domain-containing protein n=1 Tax=Xanthomonas campestris TaxID=339 RepID=UPI0023797060|nr:type IIL restriction-modification enzyme MmeI [Xanthomonas campestris]WDK48687.1 ATP phosphoribosyltransferase regulatory subunit [Xanthomonas campestris pv. campestris]WDK55060.1 ATP phosphoribosyltransferase regulatory subunit [Xanthomonas campestris pv. campestris]WDL63896.1 ATP phosphoribosyltransferase regulatory subunit [Xanthomonas campestris pv. campestris]